MHRPESISSPVQYRPPRVEDAAGVHALVRECKPLDVNSVYAYLLLCTHFADTCVVAESEGIPVGFASGYLKPADPSVIFIWQVAVSPRARGRGVGTRLLEEVLDRPACRDVRHLETTITPSNTASWVLFRSFARARRAECRETTLFRRGDFGGDGHEDEQLLRIAPLGGSDRVTC